MGANSIKKRIFIVEDNELNLKLFNDILSASGFDTSYTQDGFEAFSLIKKQKPDAILMDIQLHGISGFDVIKEIKADNEIKHTPIIVVTAFAMKDDKQKILESGCDAYISKPISINSFIDTVRQYADRFLQVS